MKLLSDKNGVMTFETSNGGTWTRPHLNPARISVVLDGWKSWRALYEVDEATKKLFPQATFLLELTPNYVQEDPLFMAVPCHIKAGTTHQMMIYEDDDKPPTQVRVKKHVNWN